MASAFVAHDTPEHDRDGGGAPGAATAGPRAEVVIHVGPELTATADGALVATLEDGTNVSAETLRRVAGDGGVIAAATDPTGQVLHVGRRTRAIPSAIRRAMLMRDHHCRFPGCTNRSFLHGHHVVHWLHGGRTALANLVTLCSFHHRQVHEGGFEISLTKDMEVKVWTPAGHLLPATPVLTPDPFTADWLTGQWDHRDGPPPAADGPVPPPLWDGEPVDYEACVDALLVN